MEFICQDHSCLFMARVAILSSVIDSSPWSRLPAGWGELFMYAIKYWRRRLPGSIRRMCPARQSLHLMIAGIRSKSRDNAVSLTSYLVMMDRQRLLKPLIVFLTLSVRLHASHKWVNAEHTPAV